ncbi:putative sporulation protein YyaC [Desulfotomaculum arcticum]|uniref:Putative sporulation protein YyaC n=1 Tax=Desulfotruncus arcticus DSM 17038 TaxID=1121424 RepID=A0A1I2WAM5_9FIRM|nr:spore protease YyaC [Desulfotruncus arcticus]SFG97709.1 putative sporulation protein YyaC [Desulfotomaculum arcticum] [Desulfotruncus arcticus DSM 17038]
MKKELHRSVHYNDKFSLSKAIVSLEAILPPPGRDILYLCIGSDLSTGDSFGPLTGTLLKRTGISNVIGSLDDTVHAKNLEEKIKLLNNKDYVVAIDATMGHYKDIGNLFFAKEPIRPGAAFRRNLAPVGDASVVFNVAANSIANFLVLGCTSLNKVWLASNLLTRAICVLTYKRKKELYAANR